MQAASAESRSIFPLHCRCRSSRCLKQFPWFLLDFSLESARRTKESSWVALAAVLGPNQNILVDATPVFVLQLPVLVESVVVGFQSELQTLR